VILFDSGIYCEKLVKFLAKLILSYLNTPGKAVKTRENLQSPDLVRTMIFHIYQENTINGKY
jgi:hypothetical protein